MFSEADSYLYTDEGLTPVCYPAIPSSMRARYPLQREGQHGVAGLRLYERFVARAAQPETPRALAAGGEP